MSPPLHPSRTGVVTSVKKTPDGYDLEVDMGSGVTIPVEHYDEPGGEHPPFPGDYVNVVHGHGKGNYRATGYSRPGEPVADSGEHRLISRDPSGNTTATFHLKADGSLEITASKVTINGVLIEQDGTMTAPKEVFWQGDGTKVAASTHLHNHAMGPTIGNPISPPAAPE